MTAEYTPRMKNFFIEANEHQSHEREKDKNLCALLSVSARFCNSSILARYFQTHIISATSRFVERVVLRCFVSPLQFTPELRIGSRSGNNHRLDGATPPSPGCCRGALMSFSTVWATTSATVRCIEPSACLSVSPRWRLHRSRPFLAC